MIHEHGADLVDRKIALEESKRTLKGQLDTVNEALAEVDGQLLTEWERTQTQNVKRRGWTVYLNRRVYAAVTGDRPALIAALRAAGGEHVISVNSNSLTAFAREMDEQGGLTPAIAAQIELRDDFSLRMRKA
jgi:hypothetical protein